MIGLTAVQSGLRIGFVAPAARQLRGSSRREAPAVATFQARVFLFDLDGTLINSYVDAEMVWHAWARSVGSGDGFDFPRLFGMRTFEVIGSVLPGVSQEELKRHAETVRLAELDHTDNVVALPGSLSLIHSLAPDSWAIVTSGDREVAQARVLAAGLPLPQVLLSAGDVERGKPDPQGLLMAAAALGVAPGECVAFDDSPVGIAAAKNAGMPAIAIRFKNDDAALAQADAIVDNLGQMIVTSEGGRYSIKIGV
jgi:sugar-phosphatase